jgi:hypothetical protein
VVQPEEIVEPEVAIVVPEVAIVVPEVAIVVPEVLPGKPVKTKKEKAPKTPKVVRELLKPQDEDTRMSAGADDSQQSRPTPSVESTPRKTRVSLLIHLDYKSIT